MTNKEATLTCEGSAQVFRTRLGVNVSAFPTYEREINAEIAVMPECFFEPVSIFAGRTMNQTAAKAINKERHYGNESVALVRSFSSCMLSHDSGQGFSAARLIEGSIKE